MRIERHSSGMWVREDGCVYVPQATYKHPAHWTYGCYDHKGYLRVRFRGVDYKVHRLVAQVFLPNPKNKPFVDHIDRNPSNNRLDNLRWATNSDNMRNSKATDRVDARGGTHTYEDMKKHIQEKNRRYYLAHR